MVTSALASGSHLLKVQVTDIAGNSEKISETVWVDTTLPAATAKLTESSDSGAKGDNLTQHQAVTLRNNQTAIGGGDPVCGAGVQHSCR
ncbi:hypothetical protein AB6E88_07860 [Providencia hangzhouensis]